jgi:hypothetical protein
MFTLNINREFHQILPVKCIKLALSELMQNEIGHSAAFEDKTQHCGWNIDWEHGKKMEAAKIPDRAST